MSIICVHNKHRKIAERVDIKVLAKLFLWSGKGGERDFHFLHTLEFFKCLEKHELFRNLKNLILNKIQGYKRNAIINAVTIIKCD